MKDLSKKIKVKPKKLVVAAKKNAYDKDYCQWIASQAKLLHDGNYDKLDITNLVEEIESLGKNDKRSLRSYTVVLLTHLLKKQFQPKGQGNSSSWEASIINAGLEIEALLKDSPSLKNELKNIYSSAYESAVKVAAAETKLPKSKFPEECPWTLEEIIEKWIQS